MNTDFTDSQPRTAVAHKFRTLKVGRILSSLFSFLNPGPGVFQGDGPIEDQFPGSGIGINAEISQTLELTAAADLCACQRSFDFGVAHNFKRARLEVGG